MEIDTLFGLPAHPLFVHLPIVLIPLLTIWAIVLAVKPELRERQAKPLAAAVVLVAIATVFAAGAGEQLEKRVGEDSLVEKHAELGEQTRLIVLIFAAAAIALAVAVHRNMQRFLAGLAVTVAILGLVSTVWVTRTGHAGAKSVWSETADAPVAGDDDGD